MLFSVFCLSKMVLFLMVFFFRSRDLLEIFFGGKRSEKIFFLCGFFLDTFSINFLSFLVGQTHNINKMFQLKIYIKVLYIFFSERLFVENRNLVSRSVKPSVISQNKHFSYRQHMFSEIVNMRNQTFIPQTTRCQTNG